MTAVLKLSELAAVYDTLPTATSYGKPRDAFFTQRPVRYLHSGVGKREIPHENVPAGAPFCFNGLDKITTLDELSKTLATSPDIYPFGSQGDFSSVKTQALVDDFFQKSVRNDAINPQTAIGVVKKLSSLSPSHERLLITALSRSRLYQDDEGKLVGDQAMRKQSAEALFEGMKSTTRYTRLDNPVGIVTFDRNVKIEGLNGSEWNATTGKVVILEKQKSDGSLFVRVIEGSTFDNFYKLSTGKRADLKAMDPRDLITPVEDGARGRVTPATLGPKFTKG